MGSTRAGNPSWSARPLGRPLHPEAGAHQSIKTPSIGIAQPGCVPAMSQAFAIEVKSILLESLSQLRRPDGSSSCLRLSTGPVTRLWPQCRQIRPVQIGSGDRFQPAHKF